MVEFFEAIGRIAHHRMTHENAPEDHTVHSKTLPGNIKEVWECEAVDVSVHDHNHSSVRPHVHTSCYAVTGN